MNVIRFHKINSTNTYLKEKYNILDNLTLVVADHQTSGKGRMGRNWIDSDDLLFSILIKERIKNPTDYSLLIASTLLKVLKDYNPKVKWPNDIMINDRKVCGILLEAVTKEKVECIIIGVGINVNTEFFPSELLIKATSLKNESKEDINKEALLNKIIMTFEDELYNYNNNNSDYSENIRSHFYLQDKEVVFKFNNQDTKGIVRGINNDGSIIIEIDDNKKVSISSGEVSFENIYKKK